MTTAQRLPISTCMIAENEAHRIRRALDSVAGWTSEIVVVTDDKVTDGKVKSPGSQVRIIQPRKMKPVFMSEPDNLNITVTIPVFNQLHYTMQCLESLKRAGIADSQIVIVNNASTDGTAEFLASRPAISTIHNSQNHRCGYAWNQGAKAAAAPWTVVLNNDVLIAPGWIEGMIGFAEEEGFDVVSPAVCEGELDYDYLTYAAEFIRAMSSAKRRGVASGACFMVHRRVFNSIGLFDDDPRLGGYEDDEFFRRARRFHFRLAITGRSFLHHFGGTTQKSIKAGLNWPNMSLGDRTYYRKKTGQTWSKRKATQLKQAVRVFWWKNTERLRYGHTLHEKRIGGIWHYC